MLLMIYSWRSPMSEQLIRAIRVDKLFGLYTYRIPTNGSLTNAAILYGDNGLGKSTILRAAFHLLSASGKGGHRTALSKIPFTLLEVDLANDVTLRAERKKPEPEGLLILSIIKNQTTLAAWDYHPKLSTGSEVLDTGAFIVDMGPDGRPVIRRRRITTDSQSVPRGEESYLKALASNVPNVFI